MFRRCVSLLVIAGFMASQVAAIPHAHGAASADQQRGHDATPHFHWQWFGRIDGDYQHSHSGHRHPHPGQRHDESSNPSTDDPNAQLPSTGLRGEDHDADAIFVPGQSATALSPKAELDWRPAALSPLSQWLSVLYASPGRSIRWHPPDEVRDASDTYLTLRNLRI